MLMFLMETSKYCHVTPTLKRSMNLVEITTASHYTQSIFSPGLFSELKSNLTITLGQEP